MNQHDIARQKSIATPNEWEKTQNNKNKNNDNIAIEWNVTRMRKKKSCTQFSIV